MSDPAATNNTPVATICRMGMKCKTAAPDLPERQLAVQVPRSYSFTKERTKCLPFFISTRTK